MTDVIEAMHVAPKTTTEVFVVMNRYGNDHWGACSTWKTLDDAQRSVGVSDTVQAWKIVKVSGLPVDVHAGEAEPPNAIGQGSAACGASPAPTGCEADAREEKNK